MGDDWNGFWGEAPAEVVAEVVDPLQRLTLPPEPVTLAVGTRAAQLERQQEDRLKTIQNRLMEQSAAVVDGALHFADIEPLEYMQDPNKPPPQEWIDELGLAGAKRRLRVALAAWQGNKTAAVGIKVATDVLGGIVSAKATEKSGPKTINIGRVILPAGSLPVFEEMEIEGR